MNCICGHAPHRHVGGVACMTVTVSGRATPDHHATAPAHLHMGRNVDHCDCPHYEVIAQ